ncbi:hypothetical protein OIDMADRAFT_57937 [Oidiodendron maius Zn]|uniref:Uncharacterized protein n=1 Tax=Oidiodendron maius (strain Zn) TaxID=913774 RepID=A0A0C3CEF4_OIDMZ|nr:hypothetical protein OIDMADRAFT_57937 [Oidiodendron maius Zn]
MEYFTSRPQLHAQRKALRERQTFVSTSFWTGQALNDQNMQLPIEGPLPLDEFLNPDDEVTVDEDSDIFAALVENYSVNRQGLEESSGEDKAELIEDPRQPDGN